MPEQFLPNPFQPKDSPDLWWCDPALVMMLSFVVVPIALAALFLSLQAVGRLLCGIGDASSRSPGRPAKSRFEVAWRTQVEVRPEHRRFTAHHPGANAAWQFRRGARRGARRRLTEWRPRRREGRRSTE